MSPTIDADITSLLPSVLSQAVQQLRLCRTTLYGKFEKI